MNKANERKEENYEVSQEFFILQQKNPAANPTLPCPKNAKSNSLETDNKEELPGLGVLSSSCTHPFITRTRLQDPAPSPPTAVVHAGWLSKGTGDSAGQSCTLTHLPLPPPALLPDLPEALRQATHPSCAIQCTWHRHCTRTVELVHRPDRKCQLSQWAAGDRPLSWADQTGQQRILLKTLCPSFLLCCPEVHPLFPELESGWSLALSSSKLSSPKPAGTVERDTQNYRGVAHGEVQASCDPHIQPQLCSAPPSQSLRGCDQAPQQHRDTDRTKPKHKLKQSGTSSTQGGAWEEKGRGQIKIKPNSKNNSGWGRYHGRLHWGCFFCSAYYTGFVVALWLRQKNMVLVPLLDSRGSTKITALLQPQPSHQTLPSPQAQSPRRGRKEECCLGCWTSSFPQRQQKL